MIMATNRATIRSLQESLDAAKRYGASVDEVERIHGLIKSRKLPPGVKDFEIKFGTDSTGDLAMWILFLVEDDKNPSQEKISKLREFGNQIRTELLSADLRYWPYIDFRSAL